MAKIINLKHSNGDYDIFIDENLLENTGVYINKIIDKKAKLCIVSDDIVYDLYGEKVKKNCESTGFTVKSFVFKNGEQSKNLSTINEIYTFLSENKFDRSDCLIALGGGVVGDITGFTAATYLRGIRFVQIPTTLLAQVDSSVGGKTGVDLPQGKNLVGVFYQPQFVLCDINALKTLPDKIYSDGMAEVIKHGCIKSCELFDCIKRKDVNLTDVIGANIRIKADVVMADEFETGVRAILNFGHTVGHAVEKYYNFEKFSHGEAVAIGMLYAAKISVILNYCDDKVVQEIKNILKLYNLPIKLDEKINNKILAEICAGDKKSEHDFIKFILLKKIGECEIVKIAKNDLVGLLDKCDNYE